MYITLTAYSRRPLVLKTQALKANREFLFGDVDRRLVTYLALACRRRAHLLRVVGQFVAKAMLDSRIIDMSFNKVFLKLVLGEEVPLTVDTLKARSLTPCVVPSANIHFAAC